MTLLLHLVAAVAAAAYVYVSATGRTGPVRAVKVIPALVWAGVIAQRWPWLALGFVAYAAGDAFLLDKKRFFLPGLLAFLAGHVWIVATVLGWGWGVSGVGLGVGLVAGGGMLALLWPGLSARMRVAVPVYTLSLVALVAGLAPLGAAAAIGATSFLLSDALLGYQKFRGPLPTGDVGVLTTYYLALGLLADALVRALPLLSS